MVSARQFVREKPVPPSFAKGSLKFRDVGAVVQDDGKNMLE